MKWILKSEDGGGVRTVLGPPRHSPRTTTYFPRLHTDGHEIHSTTVHKIFHVGNSRSRGRCYSILSAQQDFVTSTGFLQLLLIFKLNLTVLTNYS
jgi:hypothetical protein